MSDLLFGGHIETTKLDVHELVRRLNQHLGATLVAVIANVRDRKLPYKWADVDGPEPRTESYARLMAAHRAWVHISDAEDDYVARNWFIGANPRLDEQSPAASLREGKIPEVMAAAAAFVSGTDG